MISSQSMPIYCNQSEIWQRIGTLILPANLKITCLRYVDSVPYHMKCYENYQVSFVVDSLVRNSQAYPINPQFHCGNIKIF